MEIGIGPAPTATAAPPPFKTETFTVQPRRAQAFTITASRAGGRIEGYFVTTGGANDIGFEVRSPAGSDLVKIGRASNRYDFSYPIEQEGPYTLLFDNGFSLMTGKTVSLVWRAY